MSISTTIPKPHAFEHAPGRLTRGRRKGRRREAFLRCLPRATRAPAQIVGAGMEVRGGLTPKGLSLEETMQVLRNTPHEPYERPPQVLEAFERLMRRIEGEPEDQEAEVIRDASENLDKYIYG